MVNKLRIFSNRPIYFRPFAQNPIFPEKSRDGGTSEPEFNSYSSLLIMHMMVLQLKNFYNATFNQCTFNHYTPFNQCHLSHIYFSTRKSWIASLRACPWKLQPNSTTIGGRSEEWWINWEFFSNHPIYSRSITQAPDFRRNLKISGWFISQYYSYGHTRGSKVVDVSEIVLVRILSKFKISVYKLWITTRITNMDFSW